MATHDVKTAEELTRVVKGPHAKPSDHIILAGGTEAEPLVLPALKHPMPQTYTLEGRAVVRSEGGGEFYVRDRSKLEATQPRRVVVTEGGELTTEGGAVKVEHRGRVTCSGARVTASGRAHVETTDPPGVRPQDASKVRLSGQASAVVTGQGRAEVMEQAQVEAYGTALVKPKGQFRGSVELHEESRLEWRGTHQDRFRVAADDSAVVEIVELYGGRAEIEAAGEASVNVRDRDSDVTVTLRERARGDVGSGCKVRAHDAAHVEARGSAKVELHEDASVNEHGWDCYVRRPAMAS